jgi:hypothetical protein
VKAFEDRYFAAQAKRMNELIDAALSAQTRMKHQKGKCEVEEYGLGQEPEC